MTNHFENLFVLGRPAAGKSEFFDHLGKVGDAERLKKYDIAPFEAIDDWFVLADKFREDDLWEKLIGHRKYSRLDQGVEVVTDMTLYDYAVMHLNRHALENLAKNPAYYSEHSLLIEFSRGGEKNYAHTFSFFDPTVLKRAAIIYVKADFEVCWTRNVARFEEKKKHSSLAHMIPRSQLERLYFEDDWMKLTDEKETGQISVAGQTIPFVTLDNNDTPLADLRNPVVMGPKYERALGLLMKTVNR